MPQGRLGRTDSRTHTKVFQGSLWASVVLLYMSLSCFDHPPFAPFSVLPDPLITRSPRPHPLPCLLAQLAFFCPLLFIICSIIVHDTERHPTVAVGHSSPFTCVLTLTLCRSVHSIISMSRLASCPAPSFEGGSSFLSFPLIRPCTSLFDAPKCNIPWPLSLMIMVTNETKTNLTRTIGWASLKLFLAHDFQIPLSVVRLTKSRKPLDANCHCVVNSLRNENILPMWM